MYEKYHGITNKLNATVVHKKNAMLSAISLEDTSDVYYKQVIFSEREALASFVPSSMDLISTLMKHGLTYSCIHCTQK